MVLPTAGLDFAPPRRALEKSPDFCAPIAWRGLFAYM
jgi:hypothetical protein